MTETAPEVTVVENQLDKTASEVEKVEEKLDDPKTTETERKALEGRLDSLDERMDQLIKKLDTLAATPVAPSPRKVEEVTSTEAEVPKETVEETPKAKKHRYGSSTWFGARAYEDD